MTTENTVQEQAAVDYSGIFNTPASAPAVKSLTADRHPDVQTLIDEADTIIIPNEVFEALYAFKRDHKIGAESDEARIAGMQDLVDRIIRVYRGLCPSLRSCSVKTALIDNSSSGRSHYVRKVRTVAPGVIVMDGRLSIITLLHELAHHIFYDANLPQTIGNYNAAERIAMAWSVKLFSTVYPRAFRKLYVMGSLATGIMLTQARPDPTPDRL